MKRLNKPGSDPTRPNPDALGSMFGLDRLDTIQIDPTILGGIAGHTPVDLSLPNDVPQIERAVSTPARTSALSSTCA